MPDFGSADLRAGYIMDLHCASVRVHADRGYFSLVVMFVCRAVQDSFLEEYPNLIFPAESSAAFFEYLDLL